jgi:hypothetical protein
VGFSWIGEHVELLELEMGKESIASNSIEDLKGFDMTVPLREVHKLLEDGLDGEFVQEKADLKAVFGLVFENASFFDILDKLVSRVVEEFQPHESILNLRQILPLFELDVLLLVEFVLENSVLPLELQLIGPLALVSLCHADFLELVPHTPTLSDEVDNDSVNASAGALLLEAHHVLLPVVGNTEEIPLFMLAVDFGDP